MAIQILQFLSLIFSIITIIIFVSWGIRHKRKLLYIVPICVWLAHVSIFYFARLILHYDNPNILFLYTNWSAYIRFHAISTAFFSALLMTDTFEVFSAWTKRKWKSLH